MTRVFLTLIFLFFLFSPVLSKQSFAQDVVTETDNPIGIDTEATESSVVVGQRVNYELPYPGMLPDNPFYILKVLRDGIVKLLINKEMTMARFSLESAEKRMYASKLLLEKDKDKLAIETFSKSNNYLEDSRQAVINAKKQNPKDPDIKPFLQQFKSALLKHREIAFDVKKLVDKEFVGNFAIEEERINRMIKNADSLLRAK